MTRKGRHALVTGSPRGIARGIALKFAENGVNVGIHYYGNESAAKDTLDRKRGSDGFVLQADIRRPEQISRMLESVKKQFGKLDIFVSNARPEASEFLYPPMDITFGEIIEQHNHYDPRPANK